MSNTVMPGNHTDQQMSALEETRTSLCDQFASISGSDSAVAQCYLAENEWDMEVSYGTNTKGTLLILNSEKHFTE